jgi:hypothetical protein
VPKGKRVGLGSVVMSSDVHHSRRIKDAILPVRTFALINWVSPMCPVLGRYPDREEGGRCRG